ncbi:STE20-related kinase adapter protein alpha-like protein, partial [Sarcoptes scabiei]
MVINIRRHLRNESQSLSIRSKSSQHENSLNLNQLKAWDSKHYQIHNLLCQSDDNVVKIFQGIHVSTNKPVAIKIIDVDCSDEYLETVCHEISTINSLQHDNIMPMLASFVDGPLLWNVMSNAQLGSADLWSKPNGLSELAIALIVKDVLSALNYLHKKGIIHRAVCGSHILINSNGSCMLTGLKYSTTVLQKGRWQPNIHQYPKNSVKLLNFLAPEILEQNLIGYNSKSDIYSLGIVCCELANGCTPFEDIVLTEMLLDKLTDITPEVRSKYDMYKNRTYTPWFHTFTIELCLNFDSC